MHRLQRGFTLVELMIVIVLTMIVVTTFYTFTKSSLFSYLRLQTDATNLTELAEKSHRMANVLRGVTGINSAAANQIDCYGYFYPTDTYVSLISYYVSADGKALMADVTQMTSNPPIGTPITSSKKTFTIMDNFQQSAGKTLFEYTDSTGATLAQPIADLHVIKGIRINLGVATSTNSVNQAMELQVALRNRKTNL